MRMGMTPAKLGVVYDAPGIQQFIEAVGLATAKQIFLTARTYRGEELIEKGIVDYLVPKEEHESFTYDFAEKITQNAPLSLKGMKKILNMFGSNMALNEEQLSVASSLAQEGFNSDDLKEGQLAFLEKRKANFKGK